MKIGIFDSGIGGLSLLYELSARLPDAEFIYFADSENAPYGEKNADEIVALTERALLFLVGHGADAIVLACNTATAAAAKPLRAKYPELRIFGMEPAVNEAAKKVKSGKILATATPLTLGGEKYHDLLDRTGAEDRTVSLPLPALVRLAERELFDRALPECKGAEDYVRERLGGIGVNTDDVAAVVLGCTHFTYFTYVFRRLIPDRPIFNGISGTASHVINTLGLSSAPDGEKADVESIARRTEFYISTVPAAEAKMKGFLNCLELLRRV